MYVLVVIDVNQRYARVGKYICFCVGGSNQCLCVSDIAVCVSVAYDSTVMCDIYTR